VVKWPIYEQVREEQDMSGRAGYGRRSDAASWECGKVLCVPRIRVRESERPRPGRRFSPIAEKALRADALAAARGIRGASSGLVVFEEVAGPFGIPDFLAVTGSPVLLRRRVAAGFAPILNEIDAGIVAYLTVARGRRVGDLAERLHWHAETIERRLPALLRSGAIRDLGGGRFVRDPRLVPVGHLHAIETKVRDFRRALRQGRTYALWCENYVIVMPSMSDSGLLAAATVVATDRGGLMVGGSWVQRPQRRQLSAARRLWGSEHLVAAAIRARSPALSSREPLKP
jgi:hypothetical protein